MPTHCKYYVRSDDDDSFESSAMGWKSEADYGTVYEDYVEDGDVDVVVRKKRPRRWVYLILAVLILLLVLSAFSSWMRDPKNQNYQNQNYQNYQLNSYPIVPRPNSIPNSIPNSVPNSIPNSVPNSIPNSVPARPTPPPAPQPQQPQQPQQQQGGMGPLFSKIGDMFSPEAGASSLYPGEKVTPSKTVPVRDSEGRTLGCPIVTLPGASHPSIDSPPQSFVKRNPDVFTSIGTLSCTDCRFVPIQRDFRQDGGIVKSQELLKSLPRNIPAMCSAGLLIPNNALSIYSVEDDFAPKAIRARV